MAITLRTFRDAIRDTVPWWIASGNAERLLYAAGVHVDLIVDAAVEAVRRRYPGVDAFDTTAQHGRERRIRRGRAEPAATYVARLLTWWDDHHTRGGPYAMLHQLHGYYAAAPFPIGLVLYSGLMYRMGTDGTVARVQVAGWVPPTDADESHYWLIYQWPDAVGDDGLWSDPGDYDDGGVWDSDMAPLEIVDIRLVPADWTAPHAIGHVVLLATGLELVADETTWDDATAWTANGIIQVATIG